MLLPRHQQLVVFLLSWLTLVAAQGQQCYFGPGAENRGPSELVPCNGTGSTSACCLQGDTCISGNACYNFASGNLYQYGCTDINYEDSSCPYKCGSKSPWVALEYCSTDTIKDTWVCHSPESCGCEWNATQQLLTLQGRQCQDMGDLALVALNAPPALAPWVSLPPAAGGSTGYYSPTTISGTPTWVSTAIDGYTPTPITQLATYKAGPTSKIQVFPGQTPGAATYAPAETLGASAVPTGGNAAGTASAGTTATSSSASPTATSGLSTGAKIGIGAGVGGGALVLLGAIAAIIVLLCRRSRRPQPPGPPQHAFSQISSAHGQPEYIHRPGTAGSGWGQHPSPAYQQYYAPGKSGHLPYEAPAELSELANSEAKVPHELDSNFSGVSPTPSPFSAHKGLNEMQ